MNENVSKNLDKHVGNVVQSDEAAMICAKFCDKDPDFVIRKERASIEDIPAVTEAIESELEKLDCPMKTVIQINIVIDEIYSNIAKFSYENGKGPVTLVLAKNEAPNGIKLLFIDEGLEYNPLKKEDPDITLSAEERSIGGLGIFMVKKTMDNMKYHRENNKNILIITKYF